jgi:putative ABC transport system ATP-binding protein
VFIQSDHKFICLIDLSKSYQEGDQNRVVLNKTSAYMAKGEFVAVLGKSGSGKSTLLNLISGIDRVDHGQVIIDGQDMTALSDRQRTLFRRNNIGFIFQFFNLLPTLTVVENVSLPLELKGENSQDARAGALRVLEAVDLAERGDAFPDNLSGGEQQRVAIARALVHDPLLVLADEPTGNLDEETGRHILALLDRLTRQSGKNLILVTHSREAAGYADRVLILREGKLLENREE